MRGTEVATSFRPSRRPANPALRRSGQEVVADGGPADALLERGMKQSGHKLPSARLSRAEGHWPACRQAQISDLHEQMHASRRSSHSLVLGEVLARNLVDGRCHERGRYGFPVFSALAILRDHGGGGTDTAVTPPRLLEQIAGLRQSLGLAAVASVESSFVEPSILVSTSSIRSGARRQWPCWRKCRTRSMASPAPSAVKGDGSPGAICCITVGRMAT